MKMYFDRNGQMEVQMQCIIIYSSWIGSVVVIGLYQVEMGFPSNRIKVQGKRSKNI
jgi:hypothetical protein